MLEIVNSTTGLIHLVSSCFALFFGTITLVLTKGTKAHRMIGYLYVGSMFILLLSAFLIYDLFGGFGIFHVAAIISTFTLAIGMIPAIRRKRPDWPVVHFSWMYWSVIGLYAAFVSEMFTRYIPRDFFTLVGLGTGLVMLVGGICFYMKLKIWKEQYSSWK